jgi:hypothetical protein
MVPKTTPQAAQPTDADQIPLDVPPLEEPRESADDPGGAHAKGYSADPRPEPDVPVQGPIPLAHIPEDGSHVRQPEREGKVQPTGRAEERDYTPNDRLMGSDR